MVIIKILIRGKIFGKKFKLKIDNNYKNLILKFENSGINADRYKF